LPNNPKIFNRAHRNLGWLGDSPEEQWQRQERLGDVVVGIAGCDGIGGATAERLVRMGIRNIKVADPDTQLWDARIVEGRWW